MILPEHIIAMLNHWLQTPANGYFGSSYGADLNSLLLRPLSTATADIFIQNGLGLRGRIGPVSLIYYIIG